MVARTAAPAWYWWPMPQAVIGGPDPGWLRKSRKKGLPKRRRAATKVSVMSQPQSARSSLNQTRHGIRSSGIGSGGAPQAAAHLLQEVLEVRNRDHQVGPVDEAFAQPLARLFDRVPLTAVDADV